MITGADGGNDGGGDDWTVNVELAGVGSGEPPGWAARTKNVYVPAVSEL
jgi:hypothetical protein